MSATIVIKLFVPEIRQAVNAMQYHVVGCKVCQRAERLRRKGKLLPTTKGIEAAYCKDGVDLLSAAGRLDPRTWIVTKEASPPCTH